jgi:hypothetical protein
MCNLYIGESPSDEDCASVGSEDYARRARIECRAFINQIQRKLGPPPEGVRLFIKSNPHDYGNYYAVEVSFDGDDREQSEYAYACECGGGEHWDREALKEIAVHQQAVRVGASYQQYQKALGK